LLRLKNKTFLFFLVLTIAIVVIASVVYVVFFLPSGLSSSETASRLNNIYSQTQIILSNMSDNINDYNQGIDNLTFSTRMVNLKNDMVALRTELTEIRKVAFPTYTRSIDLLDLGLQWYIDALDYAQRFNFNSASQCLQWGTEDIIQSTYVLPKS
jgi:hypothetical protein